VEVPKNRLSMGKALPRVTGAYDRNSPVPSTNVTFGQPRNLVPVGDFHSRCGLQEMAVYKSGGKKVAAKAPPKAAAAAKPVEVDDDDDEDDDEEDEESD